jgi:hypothetical protein
MYDQVHLDRARLNPASRFSRPMDVVDAKHITARDKFIILRAWEVDERALQRAEDEGMGGGEHAHLHRVREALDQLKKSLRGPG